MKILNVSLTSLCSVAWLGFGLGACAPGDFSRAPVLETNDEGGDWATYRAAAVETADGLLAEGDLHFTDEAALRAHFDDHRVVRGALSARLDGAGNVVRWPVTKQHHISYCLGGFGNRAAEAEAALHAATGAWEARVDVDFFHDESQDGAPCTPQNPNVDFIVQLDGFSTSSFFPNAQRPDRVMRVDPSRFGLPAPCSLEGLFRHLLGHTLGFAHANVPLELENDAGVAEGSQVALNGPDPESVMRLDPPVACDSIANVRHVTPQDEQGAIMVYGEARRVDRLVGDFNGDGTTDIAMFRAGWHSIPVYFTQPNGNFVVTNVALNDNLINTQPDATKLVGDFDGDGRADILVADDQSAPNTVIYYSSGDGGFAPHRVAQPNGYLNDAAKTALVGRFNDDLRDDILVLRPGASSTYVMLAPAARANPFTLVTTNLAAGRRFITDDTAGRLLGDFDGDGRTDVAMWREGYASTPVYFANGAGGWVVTSVAHAANENWINDPATKKIVGRFAAPNRAGILLSRQGWNTAPIYFSNSTAANRTGTFTKTNFPAALINDPRVIKLPGDFDGDTLTDILLLDQDNPTVFRVLFAGGNGTHVDRTLTVFNRAFNAAEFNYATIRSTNPIIGRFDAGLSNDVLLWRSDWNSNPIMFGGNRLRASASNVIDPFYNLMNAR